MITMQRSIVLCYAVCRCGLDTHLKHIWHTFVMDIM
jgi:hypothetical protein